MMIDFDFAKIALLGYIPAIDIKVYVAGYVCNC